MVSQALCWLIPNILATTHVYIPASSSVTSSSTRSLPSISSSLDTYNRNAQPQLLLLLLLFIIYLFIMHSFPSVLWRCWLGDRKGIRVVKRWVLVCWWWRFDCSFARLIAPVVTTTSIILCSNKIQNGDILVSPNPGPPGKWPLKTERE